MDIIKEIVDNVGDRYIIDIQFVSFDEEQQQVEWAFKLR
jgi:hypothetical protein